MGCAAADYDNDGHTDLYVTNFGRNTLYRNRGDGRFADVTEETGVGDMGWGTGASFGDYDRDGDVDLYVANYVDFSRDYESPIPCLWKNVKVYCGPVGLLPAADVFYRNNGDGTFSEWTEQAGLEGEKFYGMSALFGDYDDDGWPDLFVANDSTPNLLFRNRRDGRFAEEALMAGVAYSGEGVTQGCMGAAWGDYDNDGLFDLFVTNFADEYNALYKNEGGGFFADVSFAAGIGAAPAELVSWGTGFFDYDNDGDRDLFVANGHTYPQADLPRVNSSYKQANSLFENREGGWWRWRPKQVRALPCAASAGGPVSPTTTATATSTYSSSISTARPPCCATMETTTIATCWYIRWVRRAIATGLGRGLLSMLADRPNTPRCKAGEAICRTTICGCTLAWVRLSAWTGSKCAGPAGQFRFCATLLPIRF